MINKVTILGRLGAEPDIRTMQSGDKVANLNVAISESWKDKQTGEKKEKTEWVKCVVFGGVVKVIQDYARKGNRIYIEGKLQTRSWEQDGVKKYATEVVVQGFGGSVQIIDWSNDEYNQDAHNQAKSNGYQPQDDMADDIPF
jgi:single-strand DNA-binding protein